MGALFDERTKFAWPIVVALLGGAAWLTSLHWNVSHAHQKLDEMKADQKAYAEGQQKILRELSRIQGKMGLMPDEK
jgi:hypothetical protein